jgi:hypothetical protein
MVSSRGSPTPRWSSCCRGRGAGQLLSVRIHVRAQTSPCVYGCMGGQRSLAHWHILAQLLVQFWHSAQLVVQLLVQFWYSAQLLAQ